MKKRAFKDAMYGQVGRLAKAMANPHRLELLDLLANGAKSVEQIARETNLSVPNASQHLQVLKREGLVKAERSGNFMFYSLSSLAVYRLWRTLRDFSMQHSAELRRELDAFRARQGSTQSITLAELKGRRDILFLDVRPLQEYEAGHLAGALHIPIDELEGRIPDLPRNRLIIAYCRGPFCTYADEAVRQLLAAGLQAIRLEENAIDYQLIND